ncbi:hypothetical protein Tco_0185413 [Tanacetum coccineum]
MAAAAAVTITPPLDAAAMPPSPPLHAPFSPPLRLLSHDSPATPTAATPRPPSSSAPRHHLHHHVAIITTPMPADARRRYYCLNIIAKLPYCREVPTYHEPLIAIVVSASVVDRSIGR